MITERIDLFEYFKTAREGAERGTLACYRHTQIAELGVKRLRPAILIIPGGAYAFVSEKEAEPVALRYFAQGFDCFVLDYDIAPHGYPVQIEEAAMAMLYLRRECAALDLTGRIAVMGFSAGGHLAGLLATLTQEESVIFGKEVKSVRPDAVLLAYQIGRAHV